MSTRPSKRSTFLTLARVLSEQSTCSRRKVGCVLVDEYHHIIGSGYNGNACGLSHCIDTPCKGAHLPKGEGLHICEAIHAEQNALMQCSDVNKIMVCYVTASPCMHCMKMLLNTSCQLIAFDEVYDGQALDMWVVAGRNYSYLPK